MAKIKEKKSILGQKFLQCYFNRSFNLNQFVIEYFVYFLTKSTCQKLAVSARLA